MPSFGNDATGQFVAAATMREADEILVGPVLHRFVHAEFIREEISGCERGELGDVIRIVGEPGHVDVGLVDDEHAVFFILVEKLRPVDIVRCELGLGHEGCRNGIHDGVRVARVLQAEAMAEFM